MKRERDVIPMSVKELHEARADLSFPEYQRQPNLWPIQKKALLIDSILQDIDVPKLYFNKTEDGDLEVVDGTQRLWTIWGFLDGEFPIQIGGESK